MRALSAKPRAHRARKRRLRPRRLNLIFDADDTLWHSNIHFVEAEQAFIAAAIEAGVAAGAAEIAAAVRRAELELIPTLGYGRQPYATALERAGAALSELEVVRDRIAAEAARIGRWLLQRHCELLPGVATTLMQLAGRHRLLLFTKGQPDEQVGKLERSGLAPMFSDVVTPREKDFDAYRRLIEDAALDPAATSMIGNSPRSDINPALKAGLRAVFIPYPHTWELEHEELDLSHPRLVQVASFPALLNLF
jgi:putative hydrolase of the HAD superfamily